MEAMTLLTETVTETITFFQLVQVRIQLAIDHFARLPV